MHLLTCKYHNHHNGTVLSLSATRSNEQLGVLNKRIINKKKKTPNPWHKHKVAHIIIIKLANWAEVFSHVNPTAWTHLHGLQMDFNDNNQARKKKKHKKEHQGIAHRIILTGCSVLQTAQITWRNTNQTLHNQETTLTHTRTQY